MDPYSFVAAWRHPIVLLREDDWALALKEARDVADPPGRS
jgi:hypothetical protein